MCDLATAPAGLIPRMGWDPWWHQHAGPYRAKHVHGKAAVKVLHIITGLGTGGAETQLRSLLQHTRHEAEVVCLYNPGAVAEALRTDGVRVVDLAMRSNRDLAAVLRLTRLIRSGGFDAVHTHLYRACLYGRAAAWLARVPVVVATEHSLQDGQLEGRVVTPAVRRLYMATERLGDRTIAVSRAVHDELRAWGVPEQRIGYVPNGLDLAALAFSPADRARVRAQLGIPSEAPVIGTVGRLHPGKRIDELVRVAAPLLEQGRHLVIVGDGPARSALEQQALGLGIADRVHLVGEQPARPFLSALDVFASPSPYETFGLAILEALANGLPVVYRRSPAVAEFPEPMPAAEKWVEDEAAVRSTLVRLLDGAPRADRSMPPALGYLAMSRVAAAIDDLYDEVLAHAGGRESVPA